MWPENQELRNQYDQIEMDCMPQARINYRAAVRDVGIPIAVLLAAKITRDRGMQQTVSVFLRITKSVSHIMFTVKRMMF